MAIATLLTTVVVSVHVTAPVVGHMFALVSLREIVIETACPCVSPVIPVGIPFTFTIVPAEVDIETLEGSKSVAEIVRVASLDVLV